MNWNQPVCDDCWKDIMGDRVPTRLTEAEEELCCFCNKPTTSGIYVRLDPKNVPYPSPDKEE